MNAEVQALLEKASRSLEAARLLLTRGFYDDSVSRAYYAMFHTAEALLESKRLNVSSHRGVLSTIGAEFIRIGLLDRKHGRRLHIAFERRRDADYESRSECDETRASETIAWAEEFLEAARAVLDAEEEE